MLHQIPSIEKLLHELNRLPGIGRKTAMRLVLYILRTPKDYSQRLRSALSEIEEKVHLCPICFSYTESSICSICLSAERNQSLLCILEEPSDIIGVESSGAFKGRYHILHGTISPLEGRRPEDLRIAELIDRINSGLEGKEPKIEEIILALDPDLEGDTTSLYLARQLESTQIKVTRIAHGVPFGSDIDFIDHKTLGLALENRVEI